VRIIEKGYRPHESTLTVKPGERRALTVTLARIPDPPKKPKQQEPDFWRDLKRKFGS
jgi:hypothetical protein